MTRRNFLLDDATELYLRNHNPPVDAVQRSLIDETAALGSVAGMQIGPDQGAFMTLLTRLVGVRFAVEVGTFTGYSALAVARGLAPGGRLLCGDVSEEWTAIARRHWEAAGVADRIELRLGPAAETLRALPQEPRVDLAVIDADKGGYRTYYDELLPRLSERGVILVDNVLWSGRVAADGDSDADTLALRDFNDYVAGDPRSEAVMLPVGDGLTLIRRI